MMPPYTPATRPFETSEIPRRFAPRDDRLRRSLGDAADFPVPALQQPLAFRGRPVLREVVVDELDVGHLRRQRRNRRTDVRRQLELLGLRAERLRLGCQ